MKKGTSIGLLGGGTFSRMMKFNEFETEMHLRFPKEELIIRNFADEGNTPGFRPHSSRPHDKHFAFPGAKELQAPEYQRKGSGFSATAGVGFHPTPDEWLSKYKTDLLFACFGSHEHFRGEDGLPNFKKELEGFIDHTLKQKYNGSSPPQLVLVTPPPFEDLSHKLDLPDGKKENASLTLYAETIVAVAHERGVPCIDLFSGLRQAFAALEKPDYTVDGVNLTREGYKLVAHYLVDHAFAGKSGSPRGKEDRAKWEALFSSVAEKNWLWHNYYKIPNGVHAEGSRHGRNGENYVEEIVKLAKMVSVRDQAIHATAQGKPFDLTAADKTTGELPKIETNFTGKEKDPAKIYQAGAESLSTFTLPEGYEISLFADESRFPNLANPCQMTFDNSGRLWVGVMPSYPHWKPGDPKPNDKLLIYEDTDQDGRADKETVFVDGLHLVSGFELVKNAQGQQEVYCAQLDSLVRFTDTDGDLKSDRAETILSGFDDHDTHHQISAFYTDPGGGIIMGEGVFLLSAIETAYGVTRGSSSGFFRFEPSSRKLDRIAQLSVYNPWGTVYDDYGQGFFLHTSTPSVWWMEWAGQKPIYSSNPTSPTLLTSEEVRPTSGLELISSRHFPEEVQGDLVLGNTIGFRGVKQHNLLENKTAYTAQYRHDLFSSSDPNVRPVDIETAPDGSLYFLDWHNVLVGHAQHSARDPLRDHVHGRIYRITYPERPLVEPAQIDGASIETLLANLTLPEARTRYRTRNELRSRAPEKVSALLKPWVSAQSDERLKLEGLWVSWGINRLDLDLLKELLSSSDHRIRAAAMQVVRYNYEKIPNAYDLITQAAKDPHGRVRLSALNIATHLEKEKLQAIYDIVDTQPKDNFLNQPLLNAQGLLTETIPKNDLSIKIPKALEKNDSKRFKNGFAIYREDAHCGTCHQNNGKGLPAAQFPPLKDSPWVTGDPETLIKISLHGVYGPIEVDGKEYNGAMPGFGAILNDEELSDVLLYVTHAWDQKSSSIITANDVSAVRKKYKDRVAPWTAEELKK